MMRGIGRHNTVLTVEALLSYTFEPGVRNGVAYLLGEAVFLELVRCLTSRDIYCSSKLSIRET